MCKTHCYAVICYIIIGNLLCLSETSAKCTATIHWEITISLSGQEHRVVQSDTESKVSRRKNKTGTDGPHETHIKQERQLIHFPPTFLYSFIQQIWVSSSKHVLKLKKPVVIKRFLLPIKLGAEQQLALPVGAGGALYLQMQKHLKDRQDHRVKATE